MPFSNPFQPDFSNLPEPVPEAATTDFFELFRPDDLLNPVGTYATLQEAVDAALDGDRINVLPGAPGGGTVTVSAENLTIEAPADYSRTLEFASHVRTLEFIGGDAIHIIGYRHSGNNVITGGSLIEGGAADDLLDGGEGDDVIGGYELADTLIGGAGNDALYGGGWRDLLRGGTGEDTLVGGIHFDTADYRDHDTALYVNLNRGFAAVADVIEDRIREVEAITSGSGDDLLVGTAGGNIILGNNGNDEIYGLAGADSLIGGYGNDMIEGSGGNDTMDGGPGSSLWGPGDDTISFYHSDESIVFDLSNQDTPQYIGAASGTDLISGFEHVLGSSTGDDTIIGNAYGNRIYGYGGNDYLDGGSHLGDSDHQNRLYGMQGDDVLVGGWARDTLVGGAGADTLTGGDGWDVFIYNHHAESSLEGGIDQITDFAIAGGGGIQLLGMDADIVAEGAQRFTFIGNAVFSGTAGELRYGTNGTDAFVQGDVDGDGLADLIIQVLGLTEMERGHFIM